MNYLEEMVWEELERANENQEKLRNNPWHPKQSVLLY